MVFVVCVFINSILGVEEAKTGTASKTSFTLCLIRNQDSKELTPVLRGGPL